MKRLIGQISAGARQPENWRSCTVFAVAFGALALLLVPMPQAAHQVAAYALAAISALLITLLLRSRSRFLGAQMANASAQKPHAPSDEDAPSAPGLAGRETLVSVLSRELTPALSPTLLGVIRIANYDRMAAFDVAVADRFLNAFHQRLETALGKTRYLARVERNCFAIWFGGPGDLQTAKAELQALAYALTQQIRGDAFAIEPELETGYAETSEEPETPAELISRALASLARPGGQAGASGAPGSRQPMTDMRRRFALEQDLRQAIGKGELALHYQPFIDTAGMRVSGAEALLRWSHPQLGAVSPAEFVPILEETGLMQDVGVWVLNTACRQLREWRTAGHTDFRMAINLSARQLQNPDLKTVIERTVKNHGLAPSNIELELTETAAMEDSALTLKLFRSLREAGFSLAIDDFGAGYSSLSYLKNLPFTKLKIDREFVSHVDQSSESRAICKALLELASGLGISALAEGVERREEVDTLALMGCTSFQGFYFARPMDAAAFTRMTTDPDWVAAACSPAAEMQGELKRCYS
ncbi:putative bifunctional diguanylate cyclase/phosphodiesterase [Henriciella aquimarina]|uniref:putative bifunctional diguanylate cyclase/phosphodiesterase n=1 Tax=Henriciella aquimarina TaxID=545261 RepID=UPI000A043805|nr:GGDEF domain-containing phosphodiesterase [Henriciella aquimarina]